MTIQIVTDSTSDIPPEIQASLPISVVPLHVHLNGHDYLDNENLTREAFYEALPTSDPHPTTGAPSPERFLAVYNDLIDQGAEAIFSIHISETLSAVIKSAQLAAKMVDKVPVFVIDSGNLSLAEGLIVIMAARAAKAGEDIESIQALIDSAIERAHAFAKLDTIDYLQKGGRINSIQHSVISILGIKPIMKMNNHVSRMEIARTKSKAFAKVLNQALKVLPQAEAFGITHANVPDQVRDLIEQIKEHIPSLPEPWISEVTPALGVHVGPGALCLNWIEGKTQQEHERKGLLEWIS
jgi:DegV family protein with EDD domain